MKKESKKKLEKRADYICDKFVECLESISEKLPKKSVVEIESNLDIDDKGIVYITLNSKMPLGKLK